MHTAALLFALQGASAIAAPSHTFTDETGARTPVMITAQKTMDAEAVDIDGDGDLDLVLAMEFAPNLILYNDGTGNFPEEDAKALSPTPGDSEDIAVADFNSDGRLDICFVSEDSPAHELYLATQDGFENASARLTLGNQANAVLAADINGDGHPDLIVGRKDTNAILINDGKANFTDESAARLPGNIKDTTQDLELGDIDGDGDLDLLVGNEDNNRLLINNGAGVFTDETSGRLPMRAGPEETREADFGDIDGDGDLDIAFANVGWVQGASPANRVLINDGAGNFTDESATRLPPSMSFTLDVDLVDYDADGDLDWVAAEMSHDGPTILVNDGKGTFAPAPSETKPAKYYGLGVDVELADLDGDGLLDLFITHFGQPDMLLRSNAAAK